MTIAENKELLRKVFAMDATTFQNRRGNPPDDPFHSKDYVHHGLRGPSNFKDRLQVMDSLLAAFPDFKFTPEDIIAEGDKVVVRYTFTGTHKGPYLGVPASGKKITFTGVGIYRISEGRLVEGWEKATSLG